MYRRSLQHFLTGEEPISVKVAVRDPFSSDKKPEKQPFTLEPLDRLAQPDTKDAFYQILDLLKEKKDWLMLPHFIRELNLSGRKLQRPMVERMIRRAAQTGYMGMAIELFRRTPVTGLKIDDAKIAMEIMLGAVHRAMAAEWGEEELGRALKNSEAALRMMLDTQHGPKDQSLSPGHEAEVVGVPLALAGVSAVKYKGAKDEDGKVKEYARRFVQCFGRRNLELDEGDPVRANVFLTEWTPSWLGINMALKVVQKEPGLTNVLGDIESSTLHPLLRRALKAEKSRDAKAEERRGVNMYNNMSSLI